MRGAILGMLLVSAHTLQAAQEPGPQTPAGRYAALAQKYEADLQAAREAIRKAKTAEERAAVRTPLTAAYAPGFLELAEAYPDSPAALDALVWIGEHAPTCPASERAREILARDHLRSERLRPVLRHLYVPDSQASERLLRAALAESPHRDIRGTACFWLASYLLTEAASVQHGDLPPGKDPAGLTREAEGLLERVVAEFPDVEYTPAGPKLPRTLGEAARGQLRELRDLAVGRPAPEIEGTDVDGKPFRLSDYRGKVVVLDFGSYTYCGVCRDMLPAERALVERFEGEPFALIGINADPDRAKLKAALGAAGVTWRTVWDGDFVGPIFGAWNVRSMPAVYVLDRQGRIRFKDVFGEDLVKAVETLLDEQ